MKLSKRLTLIGESIHNIKKMADIGTDHGQLPIMLVKSGRCQRAIASDINKGPVEIVTKSVGLARMNEKIEIRKGNGLQILTAGEVDLIVIAGMGGALIAEILEASPEICKRTDVKLILQPNTEPGIVREWLLKNNFRITKEELTFDQGKFYEMLWTEFSEVGVMDYEYPGDYEGLIGGLLVKNKHSLAIPYLEKKLVEAEDVFIYLDTKLQQMDVENKDNMTERIPQIKHKIDLIKRLIKELSACPC